MDKGKLYALFIDLSQAFDSIVHTLLWNRLVEEGLSKQLIDLIKDIYNKAKTQIRGKQGLTGFVKILKGVLQGETLSPTLFTIYIDKIVKILKNSKVKGINMHGANIKILLYADDMVLVATSKDDLQNMINILVTYFDENNLKVNLDKTKAIIFSKNGRHKKTDILKWKNMPIENVQSYTYLGIPFQSTGIFNKAKDHFMTKARVAQTNLFELLWKARIKDIRKAVMLFDSLVGSILT
ncbi:unnamed protein product, partial [Allacma fusca]